MEQPSDLAAVSLPPRPHFPGLLAMPQALFGRAPELAALRVAAARLVGDESALLLISGPAGSGKSALIAEALQRLQPAGRFHVAVASYEQGQPAAPYAALRQALGDVVRQILAADDAAIARWRQRLSDHLGPNGRAMVELIPELTWLLGPQPALIDLEPEAHRQRFLFTFRHLVAALAPPEQPLILALDNLHWADEDSLELLAAIAGDTQPRALLLVGAVRSEALRRAPHTSHLLRVLAALEETGMDVEHVTLTPLSLAAVNALTAALLHVDPRDTLPLAERIQLHAQGNPFFVIELMQALVRTGAITRPAAGTGWRWDLAAVDRLELSDDVAELLADALGQLPASTQHWLALGALLGPSFDLATLAHVEQAAIEDIAADLQPALQASLLLAEEPRHAAGTQHRATDETPSTPDDGPSSPSSPSFPSSPPAAFRFRHDRIREAALAGLADRERKALHRRVGPALLAEGEAHSERLFAATYHLNAAADELTTPEERLHLARLNLTAGQQARAAAAHDAAWSHFQQGLALLPADAWTTEYDLALTLHVAGAEAAYLSARHEAVEPLAAAALAQARSSLDRLSAYQPWMQSAIARNALDLVESLAVAALAPTKLHLPRSSGSVHMLIRLAKVRWALRGRRVERLADLPPVTDPELLAAGRIIATIGQTMQRRGDINRLALLTLEGMRHSLRYGLFPTSAVGYAAFGAMLCMLDDAPGLGGVDLAFRLGQLATKLADRPEIRPYQARIAIPVQVIINHRQVHQRESLAPLLAGFQAAMDSGDPESAAICAASYAGCAYQLGHPLTELERQMTEYAGIIAQFRQRGIELALSMSHQTVLNLLGRAADPLRLTGERCDEEALQAELAQSGDVGFLTQFLILKAHLAYLFHDYQAALQLVDQARPGLSSIAGFFAHSRFLALDALVALDCWDQAERDQRRRLLRQAQADLRRLRGWARQAPMNHEHEVRLIQAELARVQGRSAEAAEHYSAAIQLCQEHGWASDVPVAAERAARFYLASGEDDRAREHLHLARAGYLRWQAMAVVQHFDRVYAAWLPELATAEDDLAERLPTAVEIAPAVLPRPDLGALLKAAHAAAGDEDPAALVQRMMTIVVEHMNARRGVLLIPDPMEDPTGETVASLRVEAECLAGGASRALHAERLIDRPKAAAAAPRRVVNFVVHSRQRLALADVAQEVPFDVDPAVLARQIRSLLCLPLRQPGRLLGVLYLENLSNPDLLTPEQVDAVTLLATQAALTVQNARLWEERERKETEEKRETREREAENREPETPVRKGVGEVERWVAALMRQARLHLQEGHWVEANAQVDEALALARKAGDPASWRSITLSFGAELAVLPGGLQRCQRIAQQAARLAPAGDDEWQVAQLAQLATVAWLQGRLEEVIEAHRQALALVPPETTLWTTYLNDLLGFVISAHTARREYSQAQQALDAQTARLRHAGSGSLRTARLLFRQARLDMLRGAGRTSVASGLAQARHFFAEQPDHPWVSVLVPTLAGMAALAEGRPDLAEEHLRQASTGEATTPAADLLVRPSLLLAHALYAQGAADAALDVLTPVLETCRQAYTPGLIVQEGAAVIPVLRLAAQQGRCGPMAAHVLGLLGVSNVTRRLLVPETGIVLSPREVDVLELLAVDAPNRAIAERLDVDITTVKSHLTRVLAKLGVATRYEAAERARALGLGNGW